jgi:hypothetical protein
MINLPQNMKDVYVDGVRLCVWTASTNGPCPIVTVSTTNPTWSEPGANIGLRGERPATNSLSSCTA